METKKWACITAERVHADLTVDCRVLPQHLCMRCVSTVTHLANTLLQIGTIAVGVHDTRALGGWRRRVPYIRTVHRQHDYTNPQQGSPWYTVWCGHSDVMCCNSVTSVNELAVSMDVKLNNIQNCLTNCPVLDPFF